MDPLTTSLQLVPLGVAVMATAALAIVAAGIPRREREHQAETVAAIQRERQVWYTMLRLERERADALRRDLAEAHEKQADRLQARWLGEYVSARPERQPEPGPAEAFDQDWDNPSFSRPENAAPEAAEE